MGCADCPSGSAPFSASRTLPSYAVYSRPEYTGQSSREGPATCLFCRTGRSSGTHCLPRARHNPSHAAPQGIVHSLGPSLGAVSPSSALSGHIEMSPGAAMSYTICEGIVMPLDESTDKCTAVAQQSGQ